MAVGSFFLSSPVCPKQPRTSFPFYRFFYPFVSANVSEYDLFTFGVFRTLALKVRKLVSQMLKNNNSLIFSGRFWRTLSGKRQRWSLVFGGHHKLGHWLCRTQPTRGLHPNLKIYRLDTLKCHLKLLKKTNNQIGISMTLVVEYQY